VISRRSLIKSAAIATAISPFRSTIATSEIIKSTSDVKRVAVVGAGIIGSSITYNLAKRGCEVILIDKTAPAAQASGNSFAWINASYYKRPYSYHLLSTYGINEYHRLSKEIALPLRWGGSFEWFNTAVKTQELEDEVNRIQTYGSPTWMIDAAQAHNLEPKVKFNTENSIAYCAQDGAVDAKAMVDILIQHSKNLGATVISPSKVNTVETLRNNMRVIMDNGSLEVDRVVIAAGIGSTEIAQSMQIELVQNPTPGFILTTEPMQQILNGIIIAPGVHMHQRIDGRVILGEQAGPPQTQSHMKYLSERPNRYPNESRAKEHALRLLDIAKLFVPEMSKAKIEQVGIGWRPLPSDGLPAIGYTENSPRAYFAVMHSGATLAPIVGHLASMEILDNIEIDLLKDFRLDRFKA
jgi:glycine/D-amino acid oxidase-like deaminating enzyme